jgi:two-component system sensor histidine kinase/response regulator
VYDPIFRVITANGNIRHIQAAAYIERNDDGKALRVTGINLDVTDHVLLESHLRQAKEQADSASRAKTEFLANMSHEIRTPMNAILGMLQLLQQTGLDIKQGDYASKAESAAKALLGIINDILDFSRVEAGKMVLDPQPFRIDKLLSDIAVIITTNIGSKNIEVLFEVDPTIPEWVVGDDLRIQQVLINLAGNAIKFTERGEVVLSVKLSSTDEDGVWLAFAVRDTGIGLTPEQSQSIFGGFEQAEASTSRRFGGTGLGLAISQRFVHMLGGTLQVKSRLGEGCTFYFTIKCKYVRDLQVDPSEPSVIAMKDLYCLVVDDNESARVVLSNMLTSFGWKIHTADSGATALDALRRRPQNQPYDVIFIDWRMPGMDGWETVELIKKEMPKDNATIIIMVTAHSRELLSQRQAEMPTLLDGFLVKPVTSSMLYEAVAKSISGKQLPALKSVSTKVRPKRLVGVRILLVEDNSINQQVASELLQNEGANVVIAANGREGIDAVQDALTQFDIVLMDVQMPDMDGYIATKEIRKTHPQSALPIVAMTANVMATDRDAALSAGMNDHIGKPFELSQLVSTILRYTKPEQEFDDANAVIALPQSLELLNTSAAIARMAGNVEIYIRALSSFPGGMEELASKLAQALEMSDTNAVSRALHAIKGVASTIGAEQLSNLVSMIEDALHSNSVVLSTCPWSDFWRVVDETKVAVETFLTTVAIEQEDGAHVPTALNVSALCDDLKKLHRLLSSANMAADEVFEQLKKEYNFAAFPEFLLLESSISSLDFSNALVHCEILLKRVSEDIDE